MRCRSCAETENGNCYSTEEPGFCFIDKYIRNDKEEERNAMFNILNKYLLNIYYNVSNIHTCYILSYIRLIPIT